MRRGQAGRILAQKLDGNHGLFAQCSIAAHRKPRNHCDGFADPALIDAFAHGIHHSGNFIAEPGRKLRPFQINAAVKHGLCPVETCRFDFQPDLTLARLLRWHLLEFEVFRAAELMKSYDFRHVITLPSLDGRKKAKDASREIEELQLFRHALGLGEEGQVIRLCTCG